MPDPPITEGGTPSTTPGTTDPNTALIAKIQELIEAVKAANPALVHSQDYQEKKNKFEKRFEELENARKKVPPPKTPESDQSEDQPA